MICENAIHRNFQTMPRRFDGLRLHGAGYFPEKSEWVDRAGPTFNYSIILSGRGTFIHNGQKLAIEAPCVFTQFPGVRATYGPLPGTTWEEFYLTIPPEKQGELQAKGLMGKNNHLWSIQNVPTVMRTIRALLPLLETPD
ncbi:AraC family ligand binding domain-containing protein [Pontiellaceae bacterium B12219]|nr:AraC family ligand binding domain-containing protein [Pontiellaceae bacterium B12219]